MNTHAPAMYSLLVAGHYSRNDRFHSYTYALAQAYTLNVGLTAGIKIATHRQRPDGTDNMAFPSAHASNFFAIAAVTHHYFGKTAGRGDARCVIAAKADEASVPVARPTPAGGSKNYPAVQPEALR